MKRFTSQGKFLLTFLVAILSMLLATSIAHAKGGWLNTFNNLYKTSNTRLDTCGLCHVNFNKNSALNVYGDNFVDAGGKSNQTAALKAIEVNDPDSDGFSSLAEINTLFLPGWNCDNIASAVDAPADVINFVNPNGCGVATAPDISISPLTLNFGVVTVDMIDTQTTVISNLGKADLTVTGLSISGSNDFVLNAAAPSIPFALAPGSSAEVPVDYTPGEAGGDSGTLTIDSDDPDTPVLSVALTGTGVQPPVNECNIDVSPLALDFGSAEVAITKTLSTTVRNNGTADCTVEAFTLTEGSDFALNPTAPVTPSIIVPGGSVDVPVDYTPAAGGDDAGTIGVSSNDPDQPVVSVSLAGTGFVPQPQVADLDIAGFRVTKRVSFRRVKPVQIKLVIKNQSGISASTVATVVGVQNGSEVFIRKDIPVTDLVGNERTTFVLEYTPVGSGNILWTATIDDADPDDDVKTATTKIVQ